jgi:Fe-Mn family superoxide dismutase
MLTRRDMLRTAAGGAVLLTVPAAARAQEKKGGFTLPKLPYAYDALEPHIDARTMEIHHSKHHQAYVDNLNKALPGKSNDQLEEVLKNLKSLPAAQQTAVRNNGGGHWNHTFFWSVMAPKGKARGSSSSARRKSWRPALRRRGKLRPVLSLDIVEGGHPTGRPTAAPAGKPGPWG